MLPQVADVDLGYDLSGVEASWRASQEKENWSGWLPHVALDVARAFTAGSADHDRLWNAMKRPGRLTLKTKLDLWQMLRPAVQPGSTIDYRLPDEEVVLTVTASGPLQVSALTGSHLRRPVRPADRGADRGDAQAARAAAAGDFAGDGRVGVRRPELDDSRG